MFYTKAYAKYPKLSLQQHIICLPFVTVVDVIPIQIYAMDLAFLVWSKVTFLYCFCISL